MLKKSISSVELTALVNELQFLVGGKLSQIYHQEKKELLFQLHAPGAGKQLLKIITGKWLCLTDVKQRMPSKPSGFCMQLRKYVGNAIIRQIEQKGSERIVIFTLEKKQWCYVIVELFSKGNIILTDKKYTILGVLDWQQWKDRKVKPGETYIFPTLEVSWKKITKNEFCNIIRQSSKRNLATTLATDIGLGGVYAEEMCARVSIDKNLLPSAVMPEQAEVLFSVLQEFQALLQKPGGYLYEDQITPFPLSGQKEHKKTTTYNEAISTLSPFRKVSPYELKINSLQRMITAQEAAVQELQKKIEENTRKGERIYEQYGSLQKLLEIVIELRKTASWEDIKQELRKEKKITTVDLKNKSIVVEL